MNLEELLRDKMIEEVPVNKGDAADVFKLAERDLVAAKKNLEEGFADWALNIGYNAMLQAGRALMLSRGYRPTGEAKHVAVIKFVKAEYSKKIPGEALRVFDKARQKRHRAVYEEAGTVSNDEAKRVIESAESFVKAVRQILDHQKPF